MTRFPADDSTNALYDERIANIRYRRERGTTPRDEDVEFLLEVYEALRAPADTICMDCGIPQIWCNRVSSNPAHCWRWDYERFDEVATELDQLKARDRAPADTLTLGGITLNAVQLASVRDALRRAACHCHLYVEVTRPKHPDQGACPRCKALAEVDAVFASATARPDVPRDVEPERGWTRPDAPESAETKP